MRKRIIFLLLLSLLLSGCNGDPEPAPTTAPVTEPSQTQPSETEPPVTEPSETEPSETEPSKTEPTETEPTEPPTKLVSVISSITSSFGSALTRSERVFDEEGRVTQVITYSHGQETQRFAVECDENGNYIRWISGRSVTEYTYDREGRVTGTYAYLDDVLQMSSQYVWEDGLLTATIQHSPVQNLEQRLERIYDAQGRLIREDHSVNGSMVSYTVYTYAADGSVAITTYAADGSVTQTARQITVGNEVTISSYLPDGTYAGKQVKTYDSQGNLLTDTDYAADGSVSSQQRYTWRTVEVPLDCPRASN